MAPGSCLRRFCSLRINRQTSPSSRSSSTIVSCPARTGTGPQGKRVEIVNRSVLQAGIRQLRHEVGAGISLPAIYPSKKASLRNQRPPEPVLPHRRRRLGWAGPSNAHSARSASGCLMMSRSDTWMWLAYSGATLQHALAMKCRSGRSKTLR